MRILKRKGYYYLQHSFRKEGKVITKEKYLGKKIPRNIEDIKKSFLEKCSNNLFELFEKIKKEFEKEWIKYPETIKEKIKEQIAIAFTYNTNAIEGSKITLDETRELVEHKIAPNRSLRDVKETEAHVKLFLDILDKKEKLTNNLILKWHKSLFNETKSDIAGKFRDYPVRVADYIAPDWQDVKRLMNNLIEFMKKSNLNPVELSARAHYKFESVHPFGDGNGRIGRLLMNYILWHNKYPMLIIEFKKRQTYYKAFPRGEDYFVKYFLRLYLRVNKKRTG